MKTISITTTHSIPSGSFFAIGRAVVVFVVFLTVSLHAQTPKLGFFTHATGNVHFANFPASAQNGVICCPPYRSGFGTGFAGGIELGLPIPIDSTFFSAINLFDQHRRFYATLRADVVNHQGILRSSGDTVLQQSGMPSSGMRQGRIDYAMNAQLLSWGGQFLLSYRFGEEQNVPQASWIGLAGIRAGIFSQKTYSETRTIIDPLNRAVWQNGFATDTISNDRIIPNVQALNVDASVTFGLRREISLLFGNADAPEAAWMLAPELFVSLPLTSIVPNRGWSHARIHAGFTLLFPLLPIIPRFLDTLPKQDTVRVAQQSPLQSPLQSQDSAVSKIPPILTVKLQKTIEDITGLPLPAFRVRVEEFASRRVFPLLLYVFFGQSEDAIPARYQRLLAKDTAGFTLKNIFRHKEFGTLDVYYHLLNIIGQRMKSRPASSITLTGCLGAVGNSLEAEDADKTLSQRRAESVRAYLRDVWGIAENRMNIVARALPVQPSNTNDELAKNLGSDAEENRRVEISSNDWDIVKPVLDEDTLVVADFPLVHFRAAISPADSLQDRIKGWSLLLRQGDSILVRTRGTNTDFEYLWTIEYERPYSDAIIQAMLDVETSNDEHLTVKDTIQVEYISIVKKRREGIDDTERSAFRLIDFEFGNPNVTERHKRIIREDIRPVLTDRSTVRIFGNTDALGKEQVNERLSRQRAEAVAREIGIGKQTIRGEGSKRRLYPNQTPEGRFYSRTVEIFAETPVEKK